MTKYKYIPAPTKTISINELETGDVLCTHGERWLSEQIQKFMEVQAHKWYKVEMFAYFNHMAGWISQENHTIGEAIASGYNLHPIEKYYDKEAINQMIVARPKIPFTDEEKKRLIEWAERFDAKNVKYEFTNFFWWIPYIYSKGKIDFSPKGDKADDRLFCFEAKMMWWKYGRPELIKSDASKITTVSLLLEKHIPVDIFQLIINPK